jgi:hypothetical protein
MAHTLDDRSQAALNASRVIRRTAFLQHAPMDAEYVVGDRYFDDESLSEFMADAQNWSDKELAAARELLADQRRLLEATHLGHKKVRKELQQVVNSLERAIASARR